MVTGSDDEGPHSNGEQEAEVPDREAEDISMNST